MTKCSLSVLLKRVSQFVMNLKHKLRNNKINITSQIEGDTHMRGCRIGKYVYIGSHCVINYATIGNYSCIAPTTIIGGMEHSYWYPSISPILSNECIFGKETIIGNDVWIGAHVCIRQGVRIGDGAVIGAGSVVTRDVPPYTIVYGVPAKVVKKRFDSEEKERLVRDSRFWEKKPSEARSILLRIENKSYSCASGRNMVK